MPHLFQLTKISLMHVDAGHELLDRSELQLGLPNSRGGGSIVEEVTPLPLLVNYSPILRKHAVRFKKI
jgi:hypothetical protein